MLKEISGRVLLKKLGLTERFPRDTLQSTRTVLGVETIMHFAIIDVLALNCMLGMKVETIESQTQQELMKKMQCTNMDIINN